MQVKLLKTIISSVAGNPAVGIVDSLYGKKNVNEFLIAKKLNLTINQTRNILYKLADEGLVSFNRKKDSKKGGWYTYFWTLNTGKSLLKYKEHVDAEIEAFNKEINNRKSNTFFYCVNCDLEFTQENALLQDYTCPECGEILQIKDSAEQVASVEKEIEKRNEILKVLNIELSDISEKEGKAKERKAKAEVKKKKEERAAKKEARDKLKKQNKPDKPSKSKK
jgi:transcription factor E